MEDEIKSFFKVWAASIASICYCYLIARHIPRGIRLFSLLPIFYILTVLPLNLYSFHLGAPTAFYLVWLANFKLLLFSFDQGPLSRPTPKSLLTFVSIALLPIKTKSLPKPARKPDKLLDPPPNTPQKLQKWALPAGKGLLLAMVVRIYDYRDRLHSYLILCLYCCHVYLGVELVLALTGVPARALMGLELEPQFNEPYMATSLQDFWGRRWNLMVTGILRPTVYGPVRSISTRIVGRRWAGQLAIMATFVVSGLMHEVMYYYFARARPTWEVTWFFVLHGVCTAAEVAAKKAVGGAWRLPAAVSVPLTLGFVGVTGAWLFFPQITRHGVDRKAIAEYSILAEFLRSTFRRIWNFLSLLSDIY